MKSIKSHLVVWLSLAVVLGGSGSIFAAEEVSSIRCDNGVANIGNMDVDVQDKCLEPNSQNTNE